MPAEEDDNEDDDDKDDFLLSSSSTSLLLLPPLAFILNAESIAVLAFTFTLVFIELFAALIKFFIGNGAADFFVCPNFSTKISLTTALLSSLS